VDTHYSSYAIRSAGAGYVFLRELDHRTGSARGGGNLSGLESYEERAGEMMGRYMPSEGVVVDVGVADHRWNDVPTMETLKEYR
jgi:hypothetical protein